MHDHLKTIYDQPRPLVIAHRGAMAYAPMNTLAAFQLAAEQGADGIELDVWLSQDDVPVVMHDFTVSATTDGEGRIGSMAVDELKELDAGSWFDEQFAGERIPTLADVFEAVGDKLFVNVEVKSTTLQTENVVQQTLACIREHDMTERVLVSSFNPMVLRQMKKHAPEIAVGFLQDDDLPFYLSWMLLGVPYHAEHPNHKQATTQIVQKAQRKNRVVNVWTVNEAETAEKMAALGVNGIITDKPDVILGALKETQ